MSEFIAEMAKNDIVRCAVEWYEAEGRASDAIMAPDEVFDALIDDANKKLGQLRTALKAWKEAQA